MTGLVSNCCDQLPQISFDINDDNLRRRLDMNQKKDSAFQKIHTSLVEFAKKYLYSKDIQIKDKCFLLLVNLMIVGTILVVPAMFFVK